ncbi:tyrosine-type recombinase/integrase [Arcobacter arenosus]|uniref:Tyr recombinase domain-containing protein n=1 Tax=Arcobacter arenosus TaxID=2576037 RepID=A0A5R8XYI6_9BACT|nr:tyrosine-type recombinase/integrase [Arcobacter arenosus]TLP36205.1 hypothetical protein FDK22_13120 [Arcobacter arenosus]
MYLKFDLKKYNTSGLSYKDDGQIPKNKIKNGKIINTSSIKFLYPYKIQVRANKMINGKRTNIKRTYEFPPDKTLLEAVKDCSQHYIKLMKATNLDKFKKNEITEFSSFGTVWKHYLDYKEHQYKSRVDKNDFDRLNKERFYNKWLKNIIDEIPVNKLTNEDLVKVISKMKNTKTGEDLAERTKRTVYQTVNPVYSYLKMKRIVIESPASLSGLPSLNNTRKINLSIDQIKDIFLKLYNYDIKPFKQIFMWLMHGRRLNEVLTLEWKDIDFEEKIYTIRACNNKARIDMIYVLTPRLIESLNQLQVKKYGYIFPALTDNSKPMSDNTLRTHWDKLELPIVKHQLRNCIQVYLKNVHAISRDIVDSIIGHKQTQNVGDRYGNYQEEILAKKLNLMLDEIFDDDYSEKIDPQQEKLHKLKEIFPHKDEYFLKKILESI